MKSDISETCPSYLVSRILDGKDEGLEIEQSKKSDFLVHTMRLLARIDTTMEKNVDRRGSATFSERKCLLITNNKGEREESGRDSRSHHVEFVLNLCMRALANFTLSLSFFLFCLF